MRYIKKPEVVNAQPYKAGMEDGFQLSDSELAERWKKTAGKKYKGIPYLNGDYVRRYVNPGDFILVDAHDVVDADRFLSQHVEYGASAVEKELAAKDSIISDLNEDMSVLKSTLVDMESANKRLQGEITELEAKITAGSREKIAPKKGDKKEPDLTK